VVSPVPLIPQDKESCGSVTSHEENVIFIFEESRPFAPINFSVKNSQKPFNSNKPFRKELYNFIVIVLASE
jgi:hypothetical protein